MNPDNFMAEVDQRTNLAFSNEMEMLTFFLTDGQLYGLNVFKIIEILECPRSITKMPRSEKSIKGAIDFRGRAISLIDLSEAMGLPPVDRSAGVSYVLVCEYSTTTQGFLIAEPNMLLHKKWDDIISPEGGIYDHSYLTAITYHEGETIQILDVEKILVEIIGIEERVSDDLLERSRRVVKEEHRVLAVDDSKAARALIESALDQIGIRHTVVDNAEKAFEALVGSLEGEGADPFTLILSDIEMPVMDGFTFTRKVRAHPELKEIYLALHSSLSNKSNEHKAAQMGANAFIPKFQPDKIVGAILEQLGKAEAAV